MEPMLNPEHLSDLMLWRKGTLRILVKVLLLGLILLATGCINSGRDWSSRRPLNIPMGTSSLPPTEPYSYRSRSNLDGSRQAWSERRSDVYVVQEYQYNERGGISSVSNRVYTYTYTNSGSYHGSGYRYYPGIVDAPSTARPGTVYGNPPGLENPKKFFRK